MREARMGKQHGRVLVLRKKERGDSGRYKDDTSRVNDDSATRYGTARNSATRELYEDGTKTKERGERRETEK